MNVRDAHGVVLWKNKSSRRSISSLQHLSQHTDYATYFFAKRKTLQQFRLNFCKWRYVSIYRTCKNRFYDLYLLTLVLFKKPQLSTNIYRTF